MGLTVLVQFAFLGWSDLIWLRVAGEVSDMTTEEVFPVTEHAINLRRTAANLLKLSQEITVTTA